MYVKHVHIYTACTQHKLHLAAFLHLAAASILHFFSALRSLTAFLNGFSLSVSSTSASTSHSLSQLLLFLLPTLALTLLNSHTVIRRLRHASSPITIIIHRISCHIKFQTVPWSLDFLSKNFY